MSKNHLVCFQYTCLKCRLYDNTMKGQFHCDYCGICRLGGRENFFHCNVCNLCLNLNLRNNHKVSNLYPHKLIFSNCIITVCGERIVDKLSYLCGRNALFCRAIVCTQVWSSASRKMLQFIEGRRSQ